MKTYAEKLRDPRWQRVRFKVMTRDEWKCTACNADDKTLYIHHKRYDGDPWESKMEDMQTLCESCHKALGKHPKAGIWWENQQKIEDHQRIQQDEFGAMFVYEICPICGHDVARDKGSYEKCDKCGHTMLPAWWPTGSDNAVQSKMKTKRMIDDLGEFSDIEGIGG